MSKLKKKKNNYAFYQILLSNIFIENIIIFIAMHYTIILALLLHIIIKEIKWNTE